MPEDGQTIKKLCQKIKYLCSVLVLHRIYKNKMADNLELASNIYMKTKYHFPIRSQTILGIVASLCTGL